MQLSNGSQAARAAAAASSGFDWNNAAEQSIAGILGTVPEVGPLLGALVSIFWPQSGDVWGEIEARVEALIQQQLSQLVQSEVTASLQGLNNNLNVRRLRWKMRPTSWRGRPPLRQRLPGRPGRKPGSRRSSHRKARTTPLQTGPPRRGSSRYSRHSSARRRGTPAQEPLSSALPDYAKKCP